MGFVFSPELTALLSKQVVADKDNSDETAKSGTLLYHGLFVFVNPAVASLPRHRHLMGGRASRGVAAGLSVAALPPSYEALLQCSRVQPADSNWDILYTPWTCQPNSKATRVSAVA
jgi:hypothetical protein